MSVRAAGLGLVCLFGIGLAGLAPGCGPGLEPPRDEAAGAPRVDAGVPSTSGGRGGSGGAGAAAVAGSGAAATTGANAGAGGAQADDAGAEDDAGR